MFVGKLPVPASPIFILKTQLLRVFASMFLHGCTIQIHVLLTYHLDTQHSHVLAVLYCYMSISSHSTLELIPPTSTILPTSAVMRDQLNSIVGHTVYHSISQQPVWNQCQSNHTHLSHHSRPWFNIHLNTCLMFIHVRSFAALVFVVSLVLLVVEVKPIIRKKAQLHIYF